MIDATGAITSTARSIARPRPEQIAAAGIAHVPQGRGTFVDLTVDENLRIGAYHPARPRGRRRHRALVRRSSRGSGERRDQQAGS